MEDRDRPERQPADDPRGAAINSGGDGAPVHGGGDHAEPLHGPDYDPTVPPGYERAP